MDFILLDWTRMGKSYCLAGVVRGAGGWQAVRPLPVHHRDAPVRNVGWLESRAGIRGRCVWGDEDALEAAAGAGRACLDRAGLRPEAAGALLVTSEAPPLLTGLAAALHRRLGLSAGAVALEIGGACTGLLSALWTALRLLADTPAVLLLAVEAPSRLLTVEPGEAGEAAALFGDAAAACLLTARHMGPSSIGLRDVFVVTDGAAGASIQVHHDRSRGVMLHLDGVPLAHAAVRVMAEAVGEISARHGLRPDQLAAVVAHGGNGRLPPMLARRLGLQPARVWSETARTGNLGTASLPVAWAAHAQSVPGPVVWTAAGAGLQWGAAFFDSPS